MRLTCIAVVAIATAVPAHAEPRTEIRGLSFTETADTTRIAIRASRTPTFTVYKLERPTRIVLDLPAARLHESLATQDSATAFAASTWAVSTIAAQQLDDDGHLVRIVVTLARPGRYDVKSEGNEVIVSVIARDKPPAGARDDGELAKARAEIARLGEEKARIEADARRASASEAKTRAELARIAEEKARVESSAKSATDAELAKARAEIARLAEENARIEADARRASASEAKTRADLARIAEEKARVEASARNASDSELAKARAEIARLAEEKARIEADAKRASTSEAKTRAEVARLAAEKATLEAEARRREAARADAAADARRGSMRAQPAPKPAPKPARVAAVQVSAVRPMGTSMVGGVTFHGEEGYAQVDVAIAGDVKVTVGAVTKTRAELILDGVDVNVRLEGVVDVMRYGSPVRSVRTYRDPQSPKRVRLIVELIAPVTTRVQQTDTGLRWKLQGTDMA